MRCAATSLGVLSLLLLSGCMIWRAPRRAVLHRVGGESGADASEPDGPLLWSGHSAELSVRADGNDRYTPFELEVTPRVATTCRVVVTRAEAPRGVVGAWRVHDGQGSWIGTRVPQPFEFGTPLDLPPGGVLLLEFDPVAFTDGGVPEDGAHIEMTVCVTIAGTDEVIRPRMRVSIPSRRWKLQLAGH